MRTIRSAARAGIPYRATDGSASVLAAKGAAGPCLLSAAGIEVHIMLGTLSSDEIERLLQRETIARLGCHDGTRTYIVPITYTYVDGDLLGHSVEGLKLQMLRKNPHVCVEVEQVHNLANWSSVIAWGSFEELEGEEARHALALMQSRFLALTVSETNAFPSILHSSDVRTRIGQPPQSTVYRIRLTEKTGRFERTS
jgi:nitroimidazol reductase NimA-like FMN-containing flavoprotein (pyridoxamine 5'-phosphate oxidase superfamily)